MNTKQKKTQQKVKKSPIVPIATKKSDTQPEKPKDTIGRKIYQYVMQQD